MIMSSLVLLLGFWGFAHASDQYLLTVFNNAGSECSLSKSGDVAVYTPIQDTNGSCIPVPGSGATYYYSFTPGAMLLAGCTSNNCTNCQVQYIAGESTSSTAPLSTMNSTATTTATIVPDMNSSSTAPLPTVNTSSATTTATAGPDVNSSTAPATTTVNLSTPTSPLANVTTTAPVSTMNMSTPDTTEPTTVTTVESTPVAPSGNGTTTTTAFVNMSTSASSPATSSEAPSDTPNSTSTSDSPSASQALSTSPVTASGGSTPAITTAIVSTPSTSMTSVQRVRRALPPIDVLTCYMSQESDGVNSTYYFYIVPSSAACAVNPTSTDSGLGVLVSGLRGELVAACASGSMAENSTVTALVVPLNDTCVSDDSDATFGQFITQPSGQIAANLSCTDAACTSDCEPLQAAPNGCMSASTQVLPLSEFPLCSAPSSVDSTSPMVSTGNPSTSATNSPNTSLPTGIPSNSTTAVSMSSTDAHMSSTAAESSSDTPATTNTANTSHVTGTPAHSTGGGGSKHHKTKVAVGVTISVLLALGLGAAVFLIIKKRRSSRMDAYAMLQDEPYH